MIVGILKMMPWEWKILKAITRMILQSSLCFERPFYILINGSDSRDERTYRKFTITAQVRAIVGQESLQEKKYFLQKYRHWQGRRVPVNNPHHVPFSSLLNPTEEALQGIEDIY